VKVQYNRQKSADVILSVRYNSQYIAAVIVRDQYNSHYIVGVIVRGKPTGLKIAVFIMRVLNNSEYF